MAGGKTSNGQAADDTSVMLKMRESKIRILEEQVGKREGRGRSCRHAAFVSGLAEDY